MDNAAPSKATDDFGGFGFAMRTFWIEAKDLKVGREWMRSQLGSGGSPKFTSRIHGVAVSEKDGVCVIGGKEIRHEFDFTLNVDTDATKAWEWHKANSVTDLRINEKTSGEIVRILKLIDERLDKDPPTATLFTYEDDWEIGIKAGWGIECEIPQEVYTKIEEELSAGLIQSVRLGIKWEAGLVFDVHAPPSFPTNWGMFRIADDKSPEPLQGHVTSVGWAPKDQLKTPLVQDHDEATAPSLPVVDLTQVSPQVSDPLVISIPKGIVFALWAIAVSVFLLLFK
ncbi:hypothetical protein [Rhodoferax sp.]|uniref:hypothetical protein n=1 Tax=Rhodoferax sp. TaxID=50421 RepID=UPI00260C243B|nr:hypothetical protein [Rhodoferax sp.]MDD3936165.1 hypothetical protein [Rhodoferax sp.]